MCRAIAVATSASATLLLAILVVFPVTLAFDTERHQENLRREARDFAQDMREKHSETWWGTVDPDEFVETNSPIEASTPFFDDVHFFGGSEDGFRASSYRAAL